MDSTRRTALSTTVAASAAATALLGGLVTAPAAAASDASGAQAGSQAAKCRKVQMRPSDNAVDLMNRCKKKSWKVKVANSMWPDTDCHTIKAGKHWYYKSPTRIQKIINC